MELGPAATRSFLLAKASRKKGFCRIRDGKKRFINSTGECHIETEGLRQDGSESELLLTNEMSKADL